jgi:hypothetical protein
MANGAILGHKRADRFGKLPLKRGVVRFGGGQRKRREDPNRQQGNEGDKTAKHGSQGCTKTVALIILIITSLFEPPPLAGTVTPEACRGTQARNHAGGDCPPRTTACHGRGLHPQPATG